jgi:hypothetical protein
LNFIIIKDPLKYYRKEGKSGRFYIRKVDESIEYPSVTTIISQNNGKKKGGTSPSASIGTITHYQILKRYSDHLLKLPTEPIWNLSRQDVVGRIRRNLDMWNRLKLPLKTICVETALFWKDPRVAGTLDWFGYLDTDLTLLDIKTGMYYDNHPEQAACYWNMLRRKPKVCFIYLDSIIDRNPDQEAVVRYFTHYELEKGYEDFLDHYSEFKW